MGKNAVDETFFDAVTRAGTRTRTHSDTRARLARCLRMLWGFQTVTGCNRFVAIPLQFCSSSVAVPLPSCTDSVPIRRAAFPHPSPNTPKTPLHAPERLARPFSCPRPSSRPYARSRHVSRPDSIKGTPRSFPQGVPRPFSRPRLYAAFASFVSVVSAFSVSPFTLASGSPLMSRVARCAW